MTQFRSSISLLALVPFIASANTFTIQDLKHPEIDNSHFPYVISDAYPHSAETINTYLQYRYFETPLKREVFASKSTNPLRFDDEYRSVYSLYEHKVEQFTNYIQITIQGDSCGAYCEYFSNSTLFDNYSGQPVTLIDLLSKDGLRQLEKRIQTLNIERIKPYIANEPSSTADDWDIATYNMYNDCYQDIKAFHTLDKDTRFYTHEGTLTIEHGRCSNHASRALDEIGNFSNTFSFQELSQYMTHEGKQYLSNQKVANLPRKTLYGVYHGKIAKYPITIVSTRYDDWVYWYNKYQTPIRVSFEKVSDTKLRFDETSESGKIEWAVEKKDQEFEGTFNDISQDKIMRISFQ
ncbi:hypothetical protein [Vibrio sp. LaRot3]|uniref:hypothetical protein n=1 Tax=Vibrio sp. LaRot3 TaxID=2998829 RepID=UPI0022CE1FCE|nr:hypothetical protein [Vibrio sp. LaRot3]MDA0147536.1 hypothetical protein [Vibrio sp. LaRot3]